MRKVAGTLCAGTKLGSILEGLWRWRLGEYRMIQLIDGKEQAVVFLDVGLGIAIYE